MICAGGGVGQALIIDYNNFEIMRDIDIGDFYLRDAIVINAELVLCCKSPQTQKGSI